MKSSIIAIIIFFTLQSLTAQTPGTKKWEFETGGPIISSPAIGDDSTIYVGSADHKLYAINPDGTKKWEFITGDEVTASPVIDTSGVIYIGSKDHKLYAVNPDGTKKWEFETGYSIVASPAIDQNAIIYIGSDMLYALNPDGSEKWRLNPIQSFSDFYLEKNNLNVYNTTISSPPIVGRDGTIYIKTSDIQFIAVSPEGQQLWERQTTYPFFSSGAIGNDGTIYNSFFGGDLCAINIEGKVKWRLSIRDVIRSDISSPVIDSEGTIYIGSHSATLIAAGPDGTLKWAYNILQNYNQYDMSTPAIDSSGVIYCGVGNHKLYAINPDGTKRWEFATNGEVYSSPAIGKDKTIYFGSKDHKLYAVYGESSGLNNSPWPKFKGNNKNQANGFNKHCPQAEVSEKQIYTLDGKVTLDALPSYDPDGLSLHYLWHLNSKPLNNPFELIDSTSSVINIDIPNKHRGDFRFFVTVTDSVNGSSLATVIVSLGKIWQTKIGDVIDSSPAIGSDSTIYIGSRNSKLYAINPDGTIKWEFLTGDYIYSSPAIGNDGTIYVGSADHKLYAINPDGTKKWEYLTHDYIDTSPAIGSDGTIYFTAWDDRLYALNPDGTHKWHFNTGDDNRSSPVIGHDGTIYFGSYDGKFYAVNPDGTKKWEFPAFIRYSPTIDFDGTIYLPADDGLYALNPDGSKKWKLPSTESFYSSPVIGLDSAIYVTKRPDYNLYAINRDGTIKWSIKGPFFPSPIIGNDGTIYAGCRLSDEYGAIKAINPDGTIEWSFQTLSDVYCSPAITTDGTIYAASNYRGGLYAIYSESHGLADSPWPRFTHDNKNTSNFLHVTSIEKEEQETIPIKYSLSPLYPNPFNPLTHVKFTLPKNEKVEIKVYNVNGRLIGTLINENKNAGTYVLTWDASNLASGMYFVKIKAGSFIKTQKCLLLK